MLFKHFEMSELENSVQWEPSNLRVKLASLGAVDVYHGVILRLDLSTSCEKYVLQRESAWHSGKGDRSNRARAESRTQGKGSPKTTQGSFGPLFEGPPFESQYRGRNSLIAHSCARVDKCCDHPTFRGNCIVSLSGVLVAIEVPPQQSSKLAQLCTVWEVRPAHWLGNGGPSNNSPDDPWVRNNGVQSPASVIPPAQCVPRPPGPSRTPGSHDSVQPLKSA